MTLEFDEQESDADVSTGALVGEDGFEVVSQRSLRDPSLYLNRELSLLEFNLRVLELARDPSLPLLERLRFLTISTSNLDEFFEIRVSGLKQHVAFDVGLSGPDELTPQQLLERISVEAHRLVELQYQVLNDEILPALGEEGIGIIKRDSWNESQASWIEEYFQREVLPVLTPVGLDPAHPFPRILNKSLNFIVSLKGKDAFGRSSRAAVVQAPRVLPRVIALPQEVAGGSQNFVMISSVIHAHVQELFPGMKVKGCYQFRVTRDSDLWVDEEEVDDLLNALQGELHSRKYSIATRLEIAQNCSDEMKDFLLDQFQLTPQDLYRVNGPVNLHRLNALCDIVDRPDLKYRPFLPGSQPTWAPGIGIFEQIRSGDLLLHHPFQSVAPVLEMLRAAATDPEVLAIRMTLYRSGSDSPFVQALLEAARAGKEVTVVVELRARFDEAANIDLATRLQEAGARVVYGIVGYKCHSKMLLVVRREGEDLRRYVHLSTGNYHVGTMRAYTDIGLLTSDDEIARDVHEIFQQLTGLGKVGDLETLLQSPFTLHETLSQLIDKEIAEAEAGREARIVAKMNSLIEPQIIRSLYRASRAGVEIELVVRGMCCVRPGIPGVSENIRVRSTLGRFLEHTRIYFFHAGGKEKVYCSSADWMPRNFFRRVEAAFPVRGKKTRRRLIDEALRPYLEDNVQSWELQADGSYQRIEAGDDPSFCAQEHLLALLSDDPGHAGP